MEVHRAAWDARRPLARAVRKSVLNEDEGVAFRNPGLPKRLQAASQQLNSESASTMRLRDCEVMDVSATPIVSAKTGSHEPAFLEGDIAASVIPTRQSD